jgi:hypothetical protein
MLCISLWQPWSSLLVAGWKRVETRSWPIRHRGPLLVHAAKKWDAEIRGICRHDTFRSALVAVGHDGPDLPLGAIVGRVNVIDCFPTERVAVDDLNALGAPYVRGRALFVSERERAFGDYSADRFAWLCAEPFAFETPIPFRGAQGLFEVPDDVLSAAPLASVPTPARKDQPSLFDEEEHLT